MAEPNRHAEWLRVFADDPQVATMAKTFPGKCRAAADHIESIESKLDALHERLESEEQLFSVCEQERDAALLRLNSALLALLSIRNTPPLEYERRPSAWWEQLVEDMTKQAAEAYSELAVERQAPNVLASPEQCLNDGGHFKISRAELKCLNCGADLVLSETTR